MPPEIHLLGDASVDELVQTMFILYVQMKVRGVGVGAGGGWRGVYHVLPALSQKGDQSRWEDHEITGENIHHSLFYQYIVFLVFHIVGHLYIFCHIHIVHSPSRPMNDFKTHFKLQKVYFFL